jgi:hypothetical protein
MILFWALLALTARIQVADVADRLPVVHDRSWELKEIRRLSLVPWSGVFHEPSGCLFITARTDGPCGVLRLRENSAKPEWLKGDMGRCTGMVLCAETGDLFVSDLTPGVIYRFPYDPERRDVGEEAVLWVSDFHPDHDDDTAGIALAPRDYVGPILSPGTGVATDGGWNNPTGVYFWSSHRKETPGALITSSEEGIHYTDVAISSSSIFCSDAGSVDRNGLFVVSDQGDLVEFAVAPPVNAPAFLRWEGARGELWTGTSRSVLQIDAERTVHTVLTGLGNLGSAAVDFSSDGNRMFVVDSGEKAIYEYRRLSGAGDRR